MEAYPSRQLTIPPMQVFVQPLRQLLPFSSCALVLIWLHSVLLHLPKQSSLARVYGYTPLPKP